MKTYKYATFCDGNPPTTGTTHLIREIEPGRWEYCAALPWAAGVNDLLHQLEAGRLALAAAEGESGDARVQAAKAAVRDMVQSVAVVAGIPVPPNMPQPPKPPIGLLNGQ